MSSGNRPREQKGAKNWSIWKLPGQPVSAPCQEVSLSRPASRGCRRKVQHRAKAEGDRRLTEFAPQPQLAFSPGAPVRVTVRPDEHDPLQHRRFDSGCRDETARGHECCAARTMRSTSANSSWIGSNSNRLLSAHDPVRQDGGIGAFAGGRRTDGRLPGRNLAVYESGSAGILQTACRHQGAGNGSTLRQRRFSSPSTYHTVRRRAARRLRRAMVPRASLRRCARGSGFTEVVSGPPPGAGSVRPSVRCRRRRDGTDLRRTVRSHPG